MREKLSKPQSKRSIIPEKLWLSVEPSSLVTVSAPKITPKRVRSFFSAVEIRQLPAGVVVPVLMPWAAVYTYPRPR